MQTVLFFGSFNPIHIGHIALAGYVVENCGFDNLWFVVSPQNPLKEKTNLAPDKLRLQMVELAVANHSNKLKVCDDEMNMPRPSFTVNTLRVLKEKYPKHTFSVLMGADSMDTITQWKDYKNLLENNRILVYPRIGSDIKRIPKEYSVEILNAPILEISSTFIRGCIKEGKDVSYYMPHGAHSYLVENSVYK